MGDNEPVEFLFVSSKHWHDQIFEALTNRPGERWIRIKSKELFTAKNISKYQPNKIFIPHWSYIIPAEIFERYECIVFHMTDLPYGRGGSPLQNLILSGKAETKISAIQVTKGIDEGPIYLKKPLSLEGSAKQIFERSALIIFEMISDILTHKPTPIPQKGEPAIFKRRQPKEGNISELNDLQKVYDYIRMLDAESYPPAFMETTHLRFEFSNASFTEKEITATVRIMKNKTG